MLNMQDQWMLNMQDHRMLSMQDHRMLNMQDQRILKFSLNVCKINSSVKFNNDYIALKKKAYTCQAKNVLGQLYSRQLRLNLISRVETFKLKRSSLEFIKIKFNS